MKQITPSRVVIFIGAMAAVALFLYLLHSEWGHRRAPATRQEQRAAENQAAEAAEAARARQAEFLDRYLDVRFGRNPSVMMVAVAATSENGTMNRPVTDALVSRFKNEDVELIASLFKPAFFADGMFSKIFAESRDAINQLGLPGIVNGLLLAQEEVQYSTNVSLQNAVSADMRLSVVSLPFTESGREETWTILAKGTGLGPQAARANAEQLLLKEIAADTNMSLVPFSSDNQDLFP